MIVYIENPTDSNKKLLDLISEFGKQLETISILRNRRHFCTPTRKTKCLGINLTKEVKDLYSENYRTLKKEIKDTNKWKHIPYSRSGRINIIKMSALPKAIYRFLQSLLKYQ